MKKIICLIVILLFAFNLYSNQTVETNKNIEPFEIFKKGIEFFNKGDLNNAIKELEKLLKFNIEIKDYYEYLGYIYFVYGDFEQAKEIMKKVIDMNPNSIIANIVLGEIAYQENDIVNARDIFYKLLKLEPELKLSYIRLYELLKYNNPKESNKFYLKIFNLAPTKIEKYLPQIETVKLQFAKNPIFIKDKSIEKKLEIKEEVLNNIFSDGKPIAGTNKSAVIATLKKQKKISIKLNFSKLFNFSDIDYERLYIKLIQIFVALIYIFLNWVFSSKRRQIEKRFVVKHYRIIPPSERK